MRRARLRSTKNAIDTIDRLFLFQGSQILKAMFSALQIHLYSRLLNRSRCWFKRVTSDARQSLQILSVKQPQKSFPQPSRVSY